MGVFVKKTSRANIIFLGGEPTLHKDLAPAIKKAKDLGYNSITVDTNGYLFNNILSKVTPDEVDYFSFSLDGATSATNDMIRGKGSYDKCTAGIKEAVSKGFTTSLIYTVSKANIHELEMMTPLVKDLGIDRFFIQVLGIRGNSAKSSDKELRVPRSEWLKKVPETAEKLQISV